MTKLNWIKSASSLYTLVFTINQNFFYQNNHRTQFLSHLRDQNCQKSKVEVLVEEFIVNNISLMKR
jgi:hypothetical protein